MHLETAAVYVLLVDDHAIVRHGLASMLAPQMEIQVVAAVSSGNEALRLLQTTAVDVLLLDMHMPLVSGIDVLREVKRTHGTTRCLMLTSAETDEELYQTLQAGADGYLSKDASVEQVLDAIRTVHAGKRYLRGEVAERLAARVGHAQLTPRELQILNMVARGLTNKEIGSALAISSFTVKNHIQSILSKLEVCDRTEAATAAITRGLILL